MTLDVVGISTEMLLKFGGELVVDPRLLCNLPVVFKSSEVNSKVTGKGEESVLCEDVDGTEEGKVILGRKRVELVSSTEERLLGDAFSGLMFMRVVTSE
jgi:hypothetical protein